MTIQIKCENCGNEFEADEKYIGQNAECQNCHHQISITAPLDIKPAEQVEAKVAEQTETTIIKFCPKCGETVKPQARFCMKCGTPLSNAQSESTMAASTVMRETISHKEQENVSSSTITIERAEQILGPYNYGQFREMFKKNQLYLNDITRINNTGDVLTLKSATKKLGWEFPKGEKANKVIHKIGINFLLPLKKISKTDTYNNSHFIYMCIVGLIPYILLTIGVEMELSFEIIYLGYAAYFTLLWSMFFWAILSTENVIVKQCLKSFFSTCMFMFIFIILNLIGLFKFFDKFIISESTIIRIITYFFSSGLPEEICKALSIYWLLSKRGKFIQTEAIIFYGIISGLAFGISEGLLYQQGVNKEFDNVDETYFYNILRLTSLPFLHALWCGIASYFLAFAARYPMYRHWLTVIAILLPAILHAGFNGGGSVFRVLMSIITVILFLFYYRNIKTLDEKLKII